MRAKKPTDGSIMRHFKRMSYPFNFTDGRDGEDAKRCTTPGHNTPQISHPIRNKLDEATFLENLETRNPTIVFGVHSERWPEDWPYLGIDVDGEMACGVFDSGELPPTRTHGRVNAADRMHKIFLLPDDLPEGFIPPTVILIEDKDEPEGTVVKVVVATSPKYLVGPGSIHDTGARVEVIDDTDPAVLTVEQVMWLVGLRSEGTAYRPEEDVPSDKRRHPRLFALVEQLWWENELSDEDVLERVPDYAEEYLLGRQRNWLREAEGVLKWLYDNRGEDGRRQVPSSRPKTATRSVLEEKRYRSSSSGNGARGTLVAGSVSTEGEDEAPPDEAPWDGDGARLLDDIADFYGRFLIMEPMERCALALWVAHTYAIEAAHYTPYIAVTSAEKRSAKSRVLEVSALLVREPLPTANVSDAALFRTIQESHPTLLWDEIDTIFHKSSTREELRGLLNSGFQRGSFAIRMGGANMNIVERFATFCAKMFAAIGKLPDTLTDRSIPIRMVRKQPDETVERFKPRRLQDEAEALKSRLRQWLAPHVDDLLEANPELPDELDDRAQDIWEPLFALADLAGGHWPSRSRKTAIALTGKAAKAEEEQSIGIRLLVSLKEIFEEHMLTGRKTISSAEICAALNAEEEAPWGNWTSGKGISPTDLSKRLRHFGIKSRNISHPDGSKPKGYHPAEFDEIFARYVAGAVAAPPAPTRYPATKSSLSKRERGSRGSGIGSGDGSGSASEPEPAVDPAADSVEVDLPDEDLDLFGPAPSEHDDDSERW